MAMDDRCVPFTGSRRNSPQGPTCDHRTPTHRYVSVRDASQRQKRRWLRAPRPRASDREPHSPRPGFRSPALMVASMTPLRRHRAPLYRVYSEDEFLSLQELEPGAAGAPRALAVAPPERPRRRSFGAAVTSLSLRWAAPITSAAMLTGALAAAVALVTSVGLGKRADRGTENRGRPRVFARTITSGVGGVLAAVRPRGARGLTTQSTAPRRPRWADPAGRRYRRRLKRSAGAVRVAGEVAASAASVSALDAHRVVARAARASSGSVAHADFTFER
jgi:hypothetical protein